MPPPAVRPGAGVSSGQPRGHGFPPAQLALRASRGHQVNVHLPQPGDAKASNSSAPGRATAAKVVLSVDEFYYGTAGGDQPLRRKYQQQALKADTFGCNICERALSDNLRLVQHTLQHSPLIRGGDDQKMCAFCFRQFSSGAHLRGHRERVHGPAPSSCTCRICEWAFDNESAFLNHMKANHKPGEMPYVCQVCFYRSSFYSDVLQHFASFHRDSRYLLCVFCLKVSRNVVSYQKHVLRHQAGQAFHCSRCRLQFAFLADKKRHKLERHRSVRRPAKLDGLPLGSKVTIRMYGKRRLPVAAVGGGARLLQGPACLIQPMKIKTERQKGSPPSADPPRYPPDGQGPVRSGRLFCLECGGEVSDFSAHYPTHVRCLLCAFASCCSRAYAAHMIRHHVPHTKDQLLPLHRRPPPCPFFLLCSCCDFASVSGDKMAEHLLVNPEHRSATCRSRVYVEPDIPLCSDEEIPSTVEPDEPVQDEDWRLADSWKQPEEYLDGKTRIAPFTHPCGPRQPLLKNGDAVDFFNLLFPAALVELITAETNAHAKTCRYLGSGCQDWVPVTPQEIKAFLGLCILMGLQNLPEPSQYWSWNEREDGPTFQRTMSPERFKQLASHIRMGSFNADEYEPGRKASDPLRVFRRMLDILTGAMWDAYQPNCCLTVDRALLPGLEGDFRTSTSRSQPQVWLLCDSKSGYCHRLVIQMGEKVSQEAGFDVVQELVEGLENKHHQIYLANALTSVPLVQKLLAQGIYTSSSFPPPNRILPAALWEDGRLDKPGDFLQRCWGSLLATRWRDTKEMGCLSTNAHAGEADTVWRRSLTNAGGLDPLTRPMAFRLLQENMRGVDICKQLLACNPLGGILQDRHWRGLFWFLVNLSVVNAFIILRESRKDSPPAWVRDGLFTQVNFRRRLGVQLAECAHKPLEKSGVRRSKAERADQNVQRQHRMGKIGGCSKRCQHCDGNKDGAWGCVVCGVGLCKEPRCFWEFHGLSPLNQGLTDVGFLESGRSGEVEPDKVHDHLAPLEDLDFSEDECPNEPEESDSIKEEALSPPSPHPTDLSRQTATPVPKERVDFLSAHQLRVALLALCGGLRQASTVFATELQLIRFWLKEARKHLKQKSRELEVPVQGVGEACLVAWVLSQREQQLPVSESVFFHKAATLNKNGALGDTFHMSYDWAVLFMLRYQLGPTPPGRTQTRARALPQSLQASIRTFKDFTRKVIRVHHLSDSSVAVMDELHLFVDLRSFRDRQHRAEGLQFTGSVPLVTVCLSALADGTVLPALVLTKGQPIDEILPDFVVLEVNSLNPSAEEAFKLWTQKIWLQYISGPVRHRNSMLVLDQYQDHVGDVSLSNLSGWGTLPAVIPEGCSFLLQPLDLGIKPALERFLRARWNKFSAEKPKEPEDAAAPGQLQDLAAQMLIRWTVQALTRLKDLRRLWRRSFEIAGILPVTEPGEEGSDREEKQQKLLQELEEILLSSEDCLDLVQIEGEDDSDDDQKSAENNEEGDPEGEVDLEAKTNTNREKISEEDSQEGGEEPGGDTKIDGEELTTMEEDSGEEVEKETEDRKEATKERRETRIMIGEEVGHEWKITMKTRMERPQTDQDKVQEMDRR
ncbi:pogo transposable element with ZNF domain isoform X2 [Syngnathoides biaculeatus]|nr:pogo transposable element with ZNF domain isoform X2 [Syngnathoides biaculeatus]